MIKVILMSIQPKWLVKILNGEKTIEIRKSIPKCELPIDVYLYCTKKWHLYFNSYENEWETSKVDRRLLNLNLYHRDGKVVAKFTLNHVSTCLNTDYGNEEILKNACLTKQELDDYVGKRKFFAWHIDDLVIFDKPKELGEFYKKGYLDYIKPCEHPRYPETYKDFYKSVLKVAKHKFKLIKAPQSWQYAYAEVEK